MTRRRHKVGAVVFSTIVMVSVLLSNAAFAGTAAAQSGSADVVFVFDETGSMDTQAEALKDEVGNVSDELEAQEIDARYGLVTYEDEASTEVDLALSSNPDDLKLALDGISTFGGTENASHGIQTALDMDYREDAQKIIVVITDEDDDGTQTARQRTLQRVDDEDACLVAVSPDRYQNDVEGTDELKSMAGAVKCGEWTDVNTESFTTVVTDLIDVIKEEASRSVDTTGYPDFDVIQKSVSNTTVYTDETFNAEIVVKNDGSGNGRYHALITDHEQVLYSERTMIDAGTSHRFTAPISYAEADRYTLRINHRFLERVTVKERPLSESEVTVIDGTVKRSVVIPNESYEVSATVENVGDYSGYATVSLASGSDLNNTTFVANKTVYLAPNETSTIVYEATVNGNSTQNKTWTANGAVLGNASVPDGNNTEPGIDTYTHSATATSESSYELTAVVYNPGDESRMATVNFGSQPGQAESVYMVDVDAGGSVAVTKPVATSAGSGNTTQTWWVNNEPVNVTTAAP